MEGLPESSGAGEFGTHWSTTGGAAGFAQEGVYLRRSPHTNEYRDLEDLVRRKRVV